MPDESDPVVKTEFLLRAIPNDGFRYQKGRRGGPVTRLAFEPSGSDRDGLSFFREMFVDAGELAQRLPKLGNYYVARIEAAELSNLGLTIRADPQPDQPRGHCIVPELSRDAHKNKRAWAKDRERELAELAQSRIVWIPEKER